MSQTATLRAANVGAPFSVNLLPAASNLCNEMNGVRVFQVRMPFHEFAAVQRNAHQRNEDLRGTAHLKVPQIEHTIVQMLLDRRNGAFRVMKINGHTRTKIWKETPSIAPSHVLVDVYELLDPDLDFDAEALRLYNSHDSRNAVKTPAHTVQGTLNALGISMNTRWLAAGQFSEALKVAETFLPTRDHSIKKVGIGGLIHHFREELIAFDGIDPVKQRFVTPFAAAALLMLRMDRGPDTIDMLREYSMKTRNSFERAGERNGFNWLDRYRELGSDNLGKFPTSHGFGEKAVCQIIPYMIAARDNPKALLSAKEVRALTRADIAAMLR